MADATTSMPASAGMNYLLRSKIKFFLNLTLRILSTMHLKTTLLFILTIVLATTIAYAQNDTIPGAVLLPRPSDLDMDYLLGPKVPARWVWYAGRNIHNNFEHQDFSSNGFDNIANLGFQYKITPGIAVGVSIGSGLVNDLVNDDQDEGINIRFHQRWYFDMRKRIREDRGANNFSGQYIGLSEEILTFFGPDILGFPDYFRPRFQLSYGIQHRFRRHILIDMNMGVSTNMLRRNKPNDRTYLRFAPNFSVSGALFPRATQSGTPSNLRPRFHEQQRMIKVDLLGLYRQLIFENFRIGYDYNQTIYAPHVALEQKWGHLPLSTELSIQTTWQRLHVVNFNNSNFVSNTFQHAYSLETRWFYHQLRKIAAGKAGNNLSGPFVAFQYQYQKSRVPDSSVDFPYNAPINYRRAFLLWGYQQRFFKRGVAQLKLGACREALRVYPPGGIYTEVNHRLYSEVRVGLAF
jgi:hypothetical protein